MQLALKIFFTLYFCKNGNANWRYSISPNNGVFEEVAAFLQAIPSNQKPRMASAALQLLDAKQEAHGKVVESLFNMAIQGKTDVWVCLDDECIEELEYDFSEDDLSESASQDITTKTRRFRLQLLTKELLEYDGLMTELAHESISPNAKKELYDQYGYRPYFMSLLMDVTDSAIGESISSGILFQAHAINRDQRWYRCRFGEPVNEEGPANNNAARIPLCYVEFAASPWRFERRSLIIIDSLDEDACNAISKPYQTAINLPEANKRKVEDTLASLGLTSIKYAALYSIGHGNCIRIVYEDASKKKEGRILYDIGYEWRHIPKKNPNNSHMREYHKSVSHFRPNLVILSHWDSDHIYGSALGSHELFKCPWIAPSFNCYSTKAGTGKPCPPINAMRLAVYLSLIHRDDDGLLLINQEGDLVASCTSNSVNIDLWQGGKGAGDSRITINNRRGLALCITPIKSTSVRNKHKRPVTVMMGDVPYSSLLCNMKSTPKSFSDSLSQCSYLVVPHHGRKMKVDAKHLQGANNGLQAASRYAIVCNHSDKIDPTHKHELERAGFTTTCTGKKHRYIKINLRSLHKPKKIP